MLASWTCTLPSPPGINALYVNRSKAGTRGRMISAAYVKWRSEADGVLWQQKPLPTFIGKVAICMAIQEPKGLADLDGKQKALLDFLVRHKIIKGDDRRYVRLILSCWSTSITACRVTVSEMS